MTPERYRAVRNAFHAIADLEGAARAAALERLEAEDPSLRADLEPLLNDDTELADAPDFLAPIFDGAPERIGSYRILGVLGRGGMGVVYEAEQREPRRVVALKVVSGQFGGELTARRLAREAELLARLHHPGVAQIYEAGRFDAGGATRPYFAMELVRGETITDYARARRLDLRARLELIRQLCDAVQHAHDHGVVHRDLKPSNVHVTEDGRVKVLDFGVGRLVGGEAAEATLRTETGQLLGTVAYMSPEQAAGEMGAIDARTDVYAIGVIAYELLADRLPIEVRGRALHDAVRLVQEHEPSSLRSASRAFSVDVDTIVRTALSKDRSRRYASSAAMSADIGRFLEDKPIAARPPSTWDQLVKFSKRNRALVSSVAAIFLVLVGALVVTGVLLDQAVAARRQADAERAEAQEMLGILTDALTAANPERNAAGEYTVRALLREIAASLEGERRLRPAAQASVLHTLGEAYIGLGWYEAALGAFERARALRAEALGPNDPETLRSETERASALLDMARYEEGRAALEEAARRSARIFGPEAPETLERRHLLGNATARVGDYEGARAIFESILETRRRSGAYETEANAGTLGSLAITLRALGAFEDARAVNERAIEIYGETLGPRHPFTLTSRANQALLLMQMGEPEDAERILREVLAIRRETLEPGHPEIGVTMGLLSRLCFDEGRYDEAIELGLEAHDVLSAALGAEHPYTRNTARNLARVFGELGRSDEAARWRDRAGGASGAAADGT